MAAEHVEQLELFPFGNIREVLNLPPPPPLRPSDALRAAFRPFSEYMQAKEFTANTIKAFLNDMNLLAEYLGEKATLEDCSTHKLEGFLHWLRYERDAPCSLRSLDRRITTLKVFFQWLADHHVLPDNPAEPLAHYGAASPLPEILSDAQLDALLHLTRSMRDASESPDARPHLLLTLLLDTAIKKAECLRIRLEHLDLSDLNQPSVYIHYEKPRQRFKQRRLALGAEFVPTFELYMRRYQPKERLFECTGRNLEYVLHNISDLARLGTRVTFEMLRWTSAVRSYKAGMDAERLRRRLGLSQIAWHGTWPILQKLAEGPL
ncbi:MAG: site-specific integrase [Chloroflexi bacterium]|nr:site-specific integrase [Chloroflexota bacterium]